MFKGIVDSKRGFPTKDGKKVVAVKVGDKVFKVVVGGDVEYGEELYIDEIPDSKLYMGL
jgi:hypothetical protein